MVASAFATPLSAEAFQFSSVMELAMRSASVRSQAARSGSVAARASATLLSAEAFCVLVGDGVGDAFGAVRSRAARSGSVAASAYSRRRRSAPSLAGTPSVGWSWRCVRRR